MTLVVGILLGKDRKEQIALHVVFIDGCLVEKAFVDSLVYFLVAEVGIVGSQEQSSGILVAGQVKAVVPAVGRFCL